ncbi:MAG: hypothetical protein NTX11_03095 [Candidatus Saccharibacteria bacterium]|nr:hypothetical protein [Candidatus Saccharibacteria bacterium]
MQAVERVNTSIINDLRGPHLDSALRSVYGNLQEETKLQKTRRIMGQLVVNTPDEDLEVYITEFEYLITNWLDEFERQVYGGNTLKELLQE